MVQPRLIQGEAAKKHTNDVAELSDEENDVIDDASFKLKKNSGVAKRNRSGVSAEVYGEFNKKESFIAKVFDFGYTGHPQERGH